MNLCRYGKVAVIMSLFAATGWMGCGESSGDKKQHLIINQRPVDRKQIELELKPAHDAKEFICMRLPPNRSQSEPEVALVVRWASEFSSAITLLRSHGIDGNVEVNTLSEYKADFRRLANQIQKMRPTTKVFSAVQTPKEALLPEETRRQLVTCPKVNLELGPKGKVPRQVVAWARRMQARYGSDRVSYGYYPVVESVIGGKTVRSSPTPSYPSAG